MLSQITVAAAAYAAGAFTPAVLRKIKAFFVKENKAVVTAVTNEVKKL